MLNDSSSISEEPPLDCPRLVEDVVNQAMVLAQRHASELGLSNDESKVLFTYTLEQLMVMLYMRRPENVDVVIERVRNRVKQDFGMAACLPN